MKKILIVFALFISGFVSAQNISYPQIKTFTRTLTNLEVRALGTTPIELLAATSPAYSYYVIIPYSISFRKDAGDAYNFPGAEYLALTYGTPSSGIIFKTLINGLNDAGTRYLLGQPSHEDMGTWYDDFIGQSIYIYNIDGTDATAGTGGLTITFSYFVISQKL